MATRYKIATQDRAETFTNKTLTSPVINTPTGIAKSDVGLGNVDNTSNATERAATATLTNKRNTPRVYNTTSTATLTPEISTYDIFELTAQAGALTIANHSTSTPTAGEKMIIRIKDNGTARAISFGTYYRAMGNALPTTTVISKTMYLGFIWNAADNKFDLIALVNEA